MRETGSFKILSIEAKDLYAAEHLIEPSPTGYSIRDSSGNLSLRKFENTLDWSLDTKQLWDVYEKETRRKNFFFWSKGKRYTQQVINVKFNYSYKEFNKAGKNTYVRAGYQFRDCTFKDGVDVRDGLLVAIQTNVEVIEPVPDKVLGETFSFADGHYTVSKEPRVLLNKSELRNYLYTYGFTCDNIKYVRYKRSSGSARVGKCLFVNELLADKMSE